MEKIKLTTDSTCDLSQNLIDKYGIGVIPLCVITDDEHLDGVDITPDQIYDYVKKTKKLPKTAARSVEDFRSFFQQYIDEGYTIVHIGIGKELSASYVNAKAAIEQIEKDKVFLVESRSLSTGVSLLLIHAYELIQKGRTAKQIHAIETERAYSTQVSFIVETLDFLHKGGRCSGLSKFLASQLRIKPCLRITDGKIFPAEKYWGKTLPVLKKYIDTTLKKYHTPDTARAFLTHTIQEKEIVDELVQYISGKKIFKEVLVTNAQSTIVSHCGKGTLGFIYLNDGEKR